MDNNRQNVAKFYGEFLSYSEKHPFKGKLLMLLFEIFFLPISVPPADTALVLYKAKETVLCRASRTLELLYN